MSRQESPAADDLLRTLAGNVRRLRAERGLTQEALAGECRLDPRHVQKIEAGEVNVTLRTLATLARALRVEPAELLRAGHASN